MLFRMEEITEKDKAVLKSFDMDEEAMQGPEVTWDIESLAKGVKSFGLEEAVRKIAGKEFNKDYIRELLQEFYHHYYDHS